MEPTKFELLRDYFQQIESQIQFGDNKASLLIAGNSILLAVNSGLLQVASGCEREFAITCIAPSPMLGLALLSAALLVASLVCALLAILPARIHSQPPREFFLFSYVTRLDFPAFRQVYLDAPIEDLVDGALRTIHGKAGYATRKFRWLRRAVAATLASLSMLVASALFAAVQVMSLSR